MDAISNVILAFSLMVIMFGMGLSLTVKDFVQIFIKPKAILIGLFCQIIILPVVGFILIRVFTLTPEIAIGIIIVSACPGGATSNLITHLANGDTALSVSLTAISSLITLVSIPFIVNFGLQEVLGQGTEIQLNIFQTILQVFTIVILPIGLGMLLKVYKPKFTIKMEKYAKKASAIFFIVVLLAIVIKERALLVEHIQEAGLVSLSLNIITMLIGYFLAHIFKLTLKQRISISIESGIQNGTLGISIATILLNNTAYAIAPAIYGIIMFLGAGIFIYWSNRQIAKHSQIT